MQTRSGKRKAPASKKGCKEKKTKTDTPRMCIVMCACNKILTDASKAYWNGSVFYCSRQCREEKSTTCAHCGGWVNKENPFPFVRSPPGKPFSWYCSQECLNLGNVTVQCDMCYLAVEQTREQHVQGKDFCSDACEQKFIGELVQTKLDLQCKDCKKHISEPKQTEGVIRSGEWQCLQCQMKVVGAQSAGSPRASLKEEKKSRA